MRSFISMALEVFHLIRSCTDVFAKDEKTVMLSEGHGPKHASHSPVTFVTHLCKCLVSANLLC